MGPYLYFPYPKAMLVKASCHSPCYSAYATHKEECFEELAQMNSSTIIVPSLLTKKGR